MQPDDLEVCVPAGLAEMHLFQANVPSSQLGFGSVCCVQTYLFSSTSRSLQISQISAYQLLITTTSVSDGAWEGWVSMLSRCISVAENLGDTKAKGMITAVIVVLVLSLLTSLLSSGFTCTNAVSNPYETFLGPTGVYTWNSLSGE